MKWAWVCLFVLTAVGFFRHGSSEATAAAPYPTEVMIETSLVVGVFLGLAVWVAFFF